MPEVHEAFKNSGQKAGIEIWRIENFEPVPVPAQQHGNFYSGDSYIVLMTTPSTLDHNIHFWLGSSTSPDEAGAAAILTVNLDDEQFQGGAVQHREVQGHESKQFLGYFQPAIRYLDGGHASGFSHVTTNAGAEKRLFQIKGKKNVRVRQVEAKISSMNKGDCFVLDVDHDIYLYVGEKAGRMERIKAISVANHIRDQDHNGRGNVEIIDPYSNEGDVDKFFEALGSGDKESVPDDTAGGDDEEFENGTEATLSEVSDSTGNMKITPLPKPLSQDQLKTTEFENGTEATLSEVSDSTGNMKITPLPKPLSQDQLKTTECYILDIGKTGIYVWVGRKSNEKEKTEAIKTAETYKKDQNLPPWVHVSKVPEGMESTSFKEYFPNWE